jgi:hypothetical protein
MKASHLLPRKESPFTWTHAPAHSLRVQTQHKRLRYQEFRGLKAELIEKLLLSTKRPASRWNHGFT